MKNKVIKSVWLLILIGVPAAMKGQPMQDILTKLDLWQQKHPEEIVYLQTDRSLFSPGERIWFSAFIRADIGTKPLLSRELYVGLVDPNGTEVASATYRITGNLLPGDLDIPAAVSPGRYMLMAYTGWMQHEPAERVFTRELEIRGKAAPFSVRINPSQGIFKPGDRFKAGVVCRDVKDKPLELPVRYSLLVDGNKVVQGSTKTDREGRGEVSVTLPAGSGSPVLQVEATMEGITQGSTLVIPTPDMLHIAFFPEGGSLVAGSRRKIAFRAYNDFGSPVAVEAEVHDDEGPAGTVAAGTDGLGSFLLTPEEGQSYWLKVTHPAGIRDSFTLPDPQRSGVVLSLASRTPERLVFRFEQVNRRIQNYHFMAQMKGRVYWMETRRVNTTTDLEIPLEDFPAGIAEVAVFDSARTPVASRLVYVNPLKKLTIQLIPDKPAYGPKEKIGITVVTLDANGQPVSAEVSLSAVTPAPEEGTDAPDIFRWNVLTADLAGFVPLPETMGDGNMPDDLLITARYSRFDWPRVLRMLPDSPADTYPDSTGNTAWLNYNVQAVVHAKNSLALGTLPGVPCPLQDPNDPASWNSGGTGPSNSAFYNNRLSIPEMIYQIRPYTLSGGKVFFDNNSISSLSYTDGAIIAINGKLMGTDIGVLNGMLPVDIDHITVSTRSADIQKYTSLNSAGVIEVFTKVNDAFANKPEAEASAPKSGFREPSVFAVKALKKPVFAGSQTTLFWQPVIRTGEAGKVRIEFQNAKKAAPVVIHAEGMTEGGIMGSGTLQLQVP